MGNFINSYDMEAKEIPLKSNLLPWKLYKLPWNLPPWDIPPISLLAKVTVPCSRLVP